MVTIAVGYFKGRNSWPAAFHSLPTAIPKGRPVSKLGRLDANFSQAGFQERGQQGHRGGA
eukprot:1158952-Pelagomonas_calceolata.AAC.5